MSLLFRGATALRNWLFDQGLKPSVKTGVPVLVVGNLIAGGAGKTPTVLALVDLLQRQGWRVGLISRGYGRQTQGVRHVHPTSEAMDVGDEPLLLARRAQVPVAVGRDRVQAARSLLQAHPEVNLLISDDGLQHRSLHRDLQVLVFDERGTGNGWLLPAGPLRQPLPTACPPDTLVVYNAAQPTTPLPGHLGVRSLQGVVEFSRWRAGEAATADALTQLAERSQHEPIWAAAGIAQPHRFFDLLTKAGVRFQPLPLPDHFDFQANLPWPVGSVLIVTEKDAVKLTEPLLGQAEVWVAPLDFQLDAAFAQALKALMNSLSLYPPTTDHGSPTA